MKNTIVRVLALIAMLALTGCFERAKKESESQTTQIVNHYHYSLLGPKTETVEKNTKASDSTLTEVQAKEARRLRVQKMREEEKKLEERGSLSDDEDSGEKARFAVKKAAPSTKIPVILTSPSVPPTRVATAALTLQPPQGGQVQQSGPGFWVKVPYHSNPRNGKNVWVPDTKNLGSSNAIAKQMQKEVMYLNDEGVLQQFSAHPRLQGYARR